MGSLAATVHGTVTGKDFPFDSVLGARLESAFGYACNGS